MRGACSTVSLHQHAHCLRDAVAHSPGAGLAKASSASATALLHISCHQARTFSNATAICSASRGATICAERYPAAASRMKPSGRKALLSSAAVLRNETDASWVFNPPTPVVRPSGGSPSGRHPCSTNPPRVPASPDPNRRVRHPGAPPGRIVPAAHPRCFDSELTRLPVGR